MAHSSESTWAVVSAKVARSSTDALDAVALGEEAYQDLLEDYMTAGATDQLYANQLFSGSPTDPINPPGWVAATAEQVSKTLDLRLAMTSIHDIHQALNNVALGAQDRASLLRRMSN